MEVIEMRTWCSVRDTGELRILSCQRAAASCVVVCDRSGVEGTTRVDVLSVKIATVTASTKI